MKETVRFLDDRKIYFGNICKKNAEDKLFGYGCRGKCSQNSQSLVQVVVLKLPDCPREKQ